MGSKKRSKLWSWILRLTLRRTQVPEEYRAANALIKAVDKGGIPLNPAKINAIARNLGLDVSVKDPVDKTVQRIRDALKRV